MSEYLFIVKSKIKHLPKGILILVLLLLFTVLELFPISIAMAADLSTPTSTKAYLDSSVAVLESNDLENDLSFNQEIYPKTRGNLGNEVLYYIVVDRFFDGEPRNNIPEFAFNNSEGINSEERLYNDMNKLLVNHTYDPTHSYMGMYWGGDLKGVIEKLDYIKNLGVTKIILSPLQDNANGLFYHPDIHNYLRRSKEDVDEIEDDFYQHISTSYHGYWTKDWYELEEHFRQPEDQNEDHYRVFKELLNEAGNRGIGIILDITMNQTSPGHISTSTPELGAGGFLFGESWFADNGNIYKNGKLMATHWNPKTGERDPDGWFHPPMIIWDFDRATKEMLEEGQISGGMPDINQDAPQVEKYFLDATKFWMTFNEGGYQIAGFRLDAVKHINPRFWRKFEDFVLSINPDAILIGEYFSGGYRDSSSIDFIQNTNEISILDFNISEAMRRFFAMDRSWDGRTYILKENTLGHDGEYYNLGPLGKVFNWISNPASTLEIPRESLDLISDDEAKGWVSFIENHDQPRLKTYYPDMSDRAYSSLIKFQFAARGVPLIMYGTETALGVPFHPEHEGLFGIGGDPFNRPMMIWPNSQGWKSEVYNATKQMAHLRQEYPVLRYGKTRFLYPKKSNKDKDIFMLREPEDCPSEKANCTRILYAYSTHGGDFLLSFPKDSIDKYEIVEMGKESAIVDGLVPIKLAPEEAKVLVLK